MFSPLPSPSDPLSPAMEQLRIDEVRHLHALWHLGPPRPSSAPAAAHSPLAPTNPTAFKQKKKKKNNRSKGKKCPIAEQPQNYPDQGNASAVSSIPWPCNPPSDGFADDAVRGWGDLRPAKPLECLRKELSAEEQAKVAALQAQQGGIVACKAFFSRMELSDGEEEEDLMDEDDEDGNGNGGKSEKFDFFMGLFEKDGGLRGYYSKNWEKGEFCCLVCGGIGEKVTKRFGDCIALVQHSNSISKTRGREAHRAFTRAVCRVLGWNVERLPTIVLDVAERSSGEAANPKDDLQKDIDFNEEQEEVDLNHKNDKQIHVDSHASSIAWPCKPPTDDDPTDGVSCGWGDLDSEKHVAPLLKDISAKEHAKVTALQAQQGGLKASKSFFAGMDLSDDEDDRDVMDEDDEGDNGTGLGKCEFFLDLFEKDGGLREYYRNNWEKGEFFCLVCGGIGEKVGKKFGDCISLVQHSNSISKTKARQAHRVFARTVCRILGWNMERLPTIILDAIQGGGQSACQVFCQKDDMQKDNFINKKEEQKEDGLTHKEEQKEDALNHKKELANED